MPRKKTNSDVIGKILNKRGIKDVTELSPEEKETFENYQKILSKSEVSIEDIKHFLEDQIRVIELKWRDHTLADKAALIPYHTVYRILLDVMNAPQLERMSLEKHLIQLHKL